MGPFHALGDLVGLAPWVVHRLWLGTLLALAAWGAVRLVDALLDRPRGVPQAVAGAILIANPYVVVFANRTSVTLLAYALAPWLLLAAHRGLRDPRGWWWPAAVALLVTSLGGGVNAAVAGWVLLGPALLIAYEVAVAGVPARAAVSFLARAVPLTALASAWWLAPVLVQVRFGVDFLQFTEPAGAIWTSTSMSESLRMMGFWVTYLGLGYGSGLGPAFDSAPALLFAPLVVVATFAVPGLAIAGFAWTRRWRYGPFFAALALLALLAMFTGFPDGAPLRRALHFAYDRVELVRFLRTTYKAGPLLAIAIACLGGAAAGLLWQRLRGRAVLAGLAAVAGLALLVGSAWPLFAGRAVDGAIAFDRIPAEWERTAADVERRLPAGTRALVLPGQVFPYYRWGATQDAVLPALTSRPVAVRGSVPYADLRAVDLLWSTDALVQQRRTLPGQLAPLLDLMGVGQVIAAGDDERDLSGAVAPWLAAEELRRGAGLDEPDRRFGSVLRYAWPASPGLVRVLPRQRPLIVDGGAGGLVGLAALDALSGDRTQLYAADLAPQELRRAVERDADVVVSDSNRRRAILPSQPRQAEGATLGARDPIPREGAVLNPFPKRGTDAQTVAVYEGARSIRAPLSPSFVQLPEHRPYAAFDGDPDTWWSADRNLPATRHWVEIDLGREVEVPWIDLLPQREALTDVREVEVAGEHYGIEPGWNRLPVRLGEVRRLRVAIAETRGSPPGLTGGAGAIAELRIPGVRVRERLRPPLLAARALAGADLRRATVSFLLERTTGTDPFDRGAPAHPDATAVPEVGGNQSGALVAAAGDAELEIARRLELPEGRRWRADGWLTVAPGRRAEALERWGGPSGRLEAPCGAAGAWAIVSPAGRPGAAIGAADPGAGGTPAAAAVLRTRPVGTVADVRAGRPLRALPCGRPVELPGGRVTLQAPSGTVRADLLRVRSEAPVALPPPASPGRVLDPGDAGRGRRDGVRVALQDPAWLVLAESFNAGWRARCDGADLGSPRPVQGYANGWRAPAGCRDVELAFAPQRWMDAGFAVSGAACLALLGLLAAGAVTGRRRAPTAPRMASAGQGPWPADSRATPRRALAIGIAAALVGGFLFALRAGVVIGPAVALLAWRGVGARTPALVAGALTAVALPAIYLAFPPGDDGGFNSDYAMDLLGAHWVAVAVWVLLAVAVSRAILAHRAAARRGAGEGPAAP